MGYSSVNTRLRRRKNVYHRLSRRIIQGAAVITFAVLILWGLSHWVHSLWVRWGVKVEAVQSGVLQETVDLEALVINREEPVLAPAEGKFLPALKEGERVRKGQFLGSMLDSQLSNPELAAKVTSPGNGLLRLQLDGLEGMLNREFWEKIDLPGLVSSVSASTQEQTGGRVAAGGTVAVIVDNLEPTLLAVEVNAGSSTQTVEGLTELWVQIKPDQDFTRAAIVEQRRAGDKIKLLIELPDFQEELLSQRKVPVVAAVKRWTGIIVSDSSLVDRDGVSGLYLLKKGVTVWREVEVVGSSGDQAVVCGIDEGELVVVNPTWVEEGKRIR